MLQRLMGERVQFFAFVLSQRIPAGLRVRPRLCRDHAAASAPVTVNMWVAWEAGPKAASKRRRRKERLT
jgi:hypothetical protein